MELQAAVGKLGAALAGRPLLARCGQWSAARTGARRVHCCACSDDLRQVRRPAAASFPATEAEVRAKRPPMTSPAQVSFQYPEDINEVCIYRLTATDGYFLVAASTGASLKHIVCSLRPAGSEWGRWRTGIGVDRAVEKGQLGVERVWGGAVL